MPRHIAWSHWSTAITYAQLREEWFWERIVFWYDLDNLPPSKVVEPNAPLGSEWHDVGVAK